MWSNNNRPTVYKSDTVIFLYICTLTMTAILNDFSMISPAGQKRQERRQYINLGIVLRAVDTI